LLLFIARRISSLLNIRRLGSQQGDDYSCPLICKIK
jgi:hypothetical protein